MDEDAVAWYEYSFIRQLQQYQKNVTTTAITHPKDETAALHGCSMTEDIEEAVFIPVLQEQVHRRSTLHEDSRDSTSSSREEGQSQSQVPPPPPSRQPRGLSIEEAPKSARGLPLAMAMPISSKKTNTAAQVEQKLLHPVLHNIPMQFRFGCNGILSNVLFMVAYNFAVEYVDHYPASTVYLVLYFIFIPIGHAMASALVFGWPERYLSSLLSNFPIGLTAMAIGGALTAYLDRIDFSETIEEYLRDNFTFSHMPPRNADEKSEFYSSIIVLVVTSVWTYVLSVYINTPKAKSEKKEL